MTLLAFRPGLKVEHDRVALVLAAAGQREPWQPVMQGRIQVQIAKRQVRTLELGDRILQLGIERRQLVWVEDGAADALPAGFGQYFLERTLRLAGRLLKRGVAALLPLQERREVRRHHSIRGELRADRRHFLEQIEGQIAVEIALAELEGERCRIGLGAVLELGKRRTGDLEIERLSLHLSSARSASGRGPCGRRCA